MTPQEHALILTFMANNGLRHAHNFLLCDSGWRPWLHFGLSAFAWPAYQTIITRSCVLIFQPDQLIIVHLPFAHLARIAELSLRDEQVLCFDSAKVTLDLGQQGNDHYLCFKINGHRQYYYLNIDEQNPESQTYNFAHLVETDFSGW